MGQPLLPSQTVAGANSSQMTGQHSNPLFWLRDSAERRSEALKQRRTEENNDRSKEGNTCTMEVERVGTDRLIGILLAAATYTSILLKEVY